MSWCDLPHLGGPPKPPNSAGGKIDTSEAWAGWLGGALGRRCLGPLSVLVGDHGPPDMVGQAPFQASPGLPRGLTLGDLSSVVEVSAASGRPDLGDRDGVQRGVELPITRPGQPVAGLVGPGYLDRCGACVVAYADAVGNRLGRPVRPTNLAAVMSPMPTV